MTAGPNQTLRVLEGRYVVEHLGPADRPAPAGAWLALVTGPDGRTGIRRDDDALAENAWTALWSGDVPHDPQATGMLAALVAPLADAAVPVMVASAFHADLVLVPVPALDASVSALRAAGHRVAA